MRVIIVHAEQGIYIGHALGLGFWSLLDAAGQSEAVTFESIESAREHIESWKSGLTPAYDPNDFSFIELPISLEYATVPDLVRAGLNHMLGDMFENMDALCE